MIVYFCVVPGFWVAVEEARRPELRSRPLVIGGLPHQRGTVREASLPAQHHGVLPGMTLAQAHQQCPEGIFLVPDLVHYQAVWEEVCDLLRRYTPLVEPVEMGQAVFDLSGCERLWSDGWSTGRAIALQIERSTGITPSMGIASTRLVAQLASMYAGADGVAMVEEGRERAFLADLPVTLLPDVDPRLALTLGVLGLRTIGQFAALPASAVGKRFGAAGKQLYRYAHGIDPRPVLPPPDRASIVARHDCEDGSIEEAMDGIRKLAETCAAELEQRGVSGKLIELTLIWEERALPSFPLLHDEERIADDSRRALPRVESRIEGGGPLLPVPYRVHSSRLPHPPLERDMARRDGTESLVKRGEGTPPARVEHHPADGGHSTKAVSTVRTPIGTAPPLFECARRLLMQNWPRAGSGENLPRLQAIELEVREFTKPAQLSFPDFDRLDQTGSLRGLSAERRQALLENDEVFQARYGTTAFQHVAAIDPGNILTERRFHWKNGLPWENGTAKRRRS